MRCLAQRMPDMAHRPRQLQLPSLQGQLMNSHVHPYTMSACVF